jgi:hypothetical protein
LARPRNTSKYILDLPGIVWWLTKPAPPQRQKCSNERKKSPVLHRDMQADVNELDDDSVGE